MQNGLVSITGLISENVQHLGSRIHPAFLDKGCPPLFQVEMPPTRARGLTCVGCQWVQGRYNAAIPLKPTAAVNPGISSTSVSVPLDWTANTPTVPTLELSE